MNGAARWAVGAVLPLAMANLACERQPRPPEIRSAADLPAAMAWALGDQCRFEAAFLADAPGCLCEGGEPAHCAPVPPPRSREFARLTSLALPVRTLSENGSDAEIVQALWDLTWNDGVEVAEATTDRLFSTGDQGSRPGWPGTARVAALGVTAQRLGPSEATIEFLEDALQAPAPSLGTCWNRALALESVGLFQQASRALSLASETGKPHAAVVRGLDARLHSRMGVDEWASSPATLATAGGQGQSVESLAATWPQQTREWGLGEGLGGWAEAKRNGNEEVAERFLDLLGRAGAELFRRGGDRFLLDLAATIGGIETDHSHELVDSLIEWTRALAAYRRLEISVAEGHLNHALPHLVTRPALRAEAELLAAVVLYQKGDARSAEAAVANVVAEIAGRSWKAVEARAEWTLGRLAVEGGRYWSALEHFRRALETYAAIGEAGNVAAVRAGLAEVAMHVGDDAFGWQELIRSMRERRHCTESSRRFAILTTFAHFARARGYPFAALAALDEARTEPVSRTSVAKAFLDLDQLSILIEAGLWDDAERRLRELSTDSEGIREISQREVLAAESSVLAARIAAAKRPESALAEIDRARNRVAAVGIDRLAVDLDLVESDVWTSLDQPRLAEAVLQRSISETSRRADAFLDERSRSSLLTATIGLIERSVELAAASGARQKALAASLAARRIEFWNVGAAASTDRSESDLELAQLGGHWLVFEVQDRQTIRWSIRDGVAEMSTLQLAESDLEERVARIRRAIRGAGPDATAPQVGELARLLVPVDALVETDSPLMLVLDGPLHDLPFSVLPVGGAGNRSLIDLRPVVVVADGALLAAPAVLELVTNDVYPGLVLSSPQRPDLPRLRPVTLPPRFHTRDPKQGSPAAWRHFEGHAATFETYQLHAPSSRTIVFSTHAVAGTRRGSAALLLASMEAAGGVLTDDLVESIRLHGSPFVLLAGCSTGTGQRGSGRGTRRVLTDAFLRAGARAVVGTLWDVEDSSAQIWTDTLLSAMASGLPIFDAVRFAQRHLREREGTGQASDWGAFIVKVAGPGHSTTPR